jgi:hypothetical protein
VSRWGADADQNRAAADECESAPLHVCFPAFSLEAKTDMKKYTVNATMNATFEIEATNAEDAEHKVSELFNGRRFEISHGTATLSKIISVDTGWGEK